MSEFWIIFCIVAFIGVILFLGFMFYRLIFYSDPAKRTANDPRYNNKLFERYNDLLVPNYERLISEPCEEISIISEDGIKLFGRYYHNSEKSPFVYLCHSYKGNALADFCALFYFYKSMGFNILLPDLRACGNSDGKCVSLGVLERFDGISWCDYLVNRFGEDIKICLHGISSGASIAMMMLELNPPDAVKCVIEDCGYTSPKDILKYQAKLMKLPPNLCCFFAFVGALIFGHFNINAASAKKAVSSSDIPILYIHATEDEFVPFYMVNELLSAGKGEKRKLEIKDAPHGGAYPHNTKEYEAAVADFLDTYL